MPITTRVVTNPKVNGIYQVSDRDLRINRNNPNSQHNVIVTSINKKRNTARVKTITSLEFQRTNSDGEQYWVFKNSQLKNVRTGNVLPIPKTQLKSKHYSGINHDIIEVSLNKLHYKEPNDRTIFPNRYKKLIHRK